MATYVEVCRSYERIDVFRAKLLGFLPIASGTGVLFLLARDKTAHGGCTNSTLFVAGGLVRGRYHCRSSLL